MIILGIDTTSPHCALALLKDREVLGEITLSGGNTHSVMLMPAIDTLLKGCSLALDDVDLFAVTAGPGSFTGVRIGVSTVKGLTMGKDKPIACLSTLSCLARGFEGMNGIICPVMDARRGQFYNALFSVSNGKIERLTEDRLIEAAALDKELEQLEGHIYLCGDGYKLGKKLLTCKNICPTPLPLINPRGVSVGLEGLEEYLSGSELIKSDMQAAPVYLRASQAERERKEKEKKTQ